MVSPDEFATNPATLNELNENDDIVASTDESTHTYTADVGDADDGGSCVGHGACEAATGGRLASTGGAALASQRTRKAPAVCRPRVCSGQPTKCQH